MRAVVEVDLRYEEEERDAEVVEDAGKTFREASEAASCAQERLKDALVAVNRAIWKAVGGKGRKKKEEKGLG